MKLEIEVPYDAGELFKYLATGGYLCSNHPEESHMRLYRICETYEEGLKELWRVCGCKFHSHLSTHFTLMFPPVS